MGLTRNSSRRKGIGEKERTTIFCNKRSLRLTRARTLPWRRYFADKMGREEGIETVEYKNTVGMKAGHGAYHDGDTYHGSGRNSSMTLPRRGIGIHFSRGDVEWEVEEAGGSKIWKKYVANGETELDENVFPIVWRRKTDKVRRKNNK